MHPSIHLWRYSPFRALASLTRRLHSSLFVALLLHPLVPGSCSASLWTTSAHLVLGLPTGLVVWKFLFRTFFGILSSTLIIWPTHSSFLILMSSTMFGTLYKLYSSLFHLGRWHPPSCVGPYILQNIFLSNVFSFSTQNMYFDLTKFVHYYLVLNCYIFYILKILNFPWCLMGLPQSTCVCNLISSYFAACDCSTCGTRECDSHTGQCHCRDNVVGEKCDRCQAEHYGFNSCQVCECNEYGMW